MSTSILEFPSDSDMEAPIPDGTEAVVRVRTNADGEVEPREGTSKNGQAFTRFLFVIDEGPHEGRVCSLTLWPDPHSRRFRTQLQQLTGIDISEGARLQWPTDLFGPLRGNRFRVTLQTRGEFVNINDVIAREPREEMPVPEIGSVDAPVGGGGDEDIPF